MFERKDIVDAELKVSLGDGIEVLSKLDFFVCKLTEFSVRETDVHLVVNVGPLGSEVVGNAVVGVTTDEVRCLSEIAKFELFLGGSGLADGVSSQVLDSLLRRCK